MRPLRIGVNALYLIPGGVGGTEVYVRSLLAALAEIDRANRYWVFTNQETGADLVPAGFTYAPQAVKAAWRPLRILWEQTGLPMEAARLKLDVMLNPGFTSPVFRPCPMVTVFHDLQHKRHPEFFRRLDLPFWNVLLYASAMRSRGLIAVSQATARDLRRFYRIPAERIRVVPHGVDKALFEIGAARSPADPPFLLAVSTLHPHKNLDGLLRAFARFRRTRPEFRLVIAGLRGFYTAELEALREELGLDEAVEFTGWIGRARLYELYRAAFAFIYPSLFEGFGMPVLEAMAAGVPVACSGIAPINEFASGAALEFDPGSEDSIAAAIERLAGDEALRRELAAAGPARAAGYTWEAAARATLEVLETAAKAAR